MIRRAGADDSAALVTLCAAHARFERAPAGTAPDADGLRAGLSGASPAVFAWVAEEAAVAIGYASGHAGFCTWRGRRMFHLDCLSLREQWRGKDSAERCWMPSSATPASTVPSVWNG
ncbi:hypothetical protein NRY95_08185 [Xanthomonas campestris pv. phormiicola]|nr:hypothetical protein [Xanthomonas campestris pv. phormiicola]UYC17919.1 hypothetical protein NRY95_08185 [Xanthomonas campestris pv. phormiicola]